MTTTTTTSVLIEGFELAAVKRGDFYYGLSYSDLRKALGLTAADRLPANFTTDHVITRAEVNGELTEFVDHRDAVKLVAAYADALNPNAISMMSAMTQDGAAAIGFLTTRIEFYLELDAE